jgi:hypothetical protein
LVAAIAFAALCLPATVFGAVINPALTGSVSNSLTLAGVTSTAIPGPFLNQNYAYTTDYYRGTLGVVDVSNPAQPTIVGESASANSMINSNTVNIFGGYAYVVSKNRNGPSASKTNDDGTGNGLTILDISTNPTQPIVVGSVRDPINLFGAYGIAVSGSYAYVAAQGCLTGQPCPNPNVGDSFVVVDISNPFNPTIVATIKNSNLPAPWTGSGALKHATAVAISGNYAYVTASYSDRLTVIDISNPLSPTIVSSLQDTSKLDFDVDVAVANGYAYVADQGTGLGRLAVVDVHDPSQPQIVGVVTSTNSQLNGAYRIRLRGNFAYVSAFSAPGLAAVDISDPTAPRYAGSFKSAATFNKTTGLDVGATGRYLFGTSPFLSTQAQPLYPPFPFASGSPTMTGTFAGLDLAPSPIAVTITSASKPATRTTQTSAAFTFSVNLAVSSVRCRLDGGPYGLCTSATTQSFAGLGAGNHTFDVQATDAAGNTDTDTDSWTVVPTVPTTAPTAPVLDDFNRADGPVGSSWSVIRPNPGFAAMNVSGNVAVDASSSAFAWNYWNATTFGPDVEAYATISRLGASDTMRVGARVTGGNAHSGYYVSISSAGSWSIIRVDNGSSTTTTLTSVQRPVAAGDSVGIRIIGSVVIALHRSGGNDWVQVLSYDTASDPIRYTNAGRVALEFKTSAFDDFGGGTYSAPSAPANTSPPTITGSAVEGQTLTASPGVWTGQPAPTFSYQWLRCDGLGLSCVEIDEGLTYTLTSNDVGSTIAVNVTASNSAGSAGPVSSAISGVVQSAASSAPANSSPPTISGTAVEGQQLTASPGDWSGQPAPTFTYQWLQCDSSGGSCAPIAGQTATTYTVATADVGFTIAVAVTATNTAGSAGPVNSAATGVVQAATNAPANTTPPSISGSAVENQVLAASPGVWTGQPAPTFTYQWLRCNSAGNSCSPIAGETASSYTLVTGDVGSTIAVAVTATNTAGSAGPVNSAATVVVQPAPVAPANTTPPSISGSALEGQVLTASAGVWTGQPAPTFAYQWLRCDSSGSSCSPIAGQTASTYTLVTADVGSTIAVAVTATNTAGSAGPVSSPATGVVQSSSTAPANSSPPTISGTLTGGSVLTASPGVWTGQPAPTFTYQWLRCNSAGSSCSPIAGQTGSTYTLVTADVGSTIAVAVTATNTVGSAGPVNSAPTGVIVSSLAPTTPILDNFNRANGPAGTNWSLLRPNGFAAMNVSSNAAVDSSATAFTWDYWNLANFGPNCEAYFTIANLGADVMRLGCRVSGAGTTKDSGYYVAVTPAGAWTILRIDNGGNPVTLASGTRAVAAGDKVAIRIVGTVVRALHYSSAAGWVQVLSYDTAPDSVKYSAAGRLAIEFRSANIDDFGGGALP